MKGGDEILRFCEEYISQTPVFQEQGVQFKVATSNSASMRVEHVLDYLNWMLPLLRRSFGGGSWGIILCDAYRAHMADAIIRLAWQYKFVVVFVGGGATGVVQVNDTHLHGPLSRDYLDREMTCMFEAMQVDPNGSPGRTRYQCLFDLMTVWKREALHRRSSEGFLDNMLSNALDGSEDHKASSECGGFWKELNMDHERTRAIQDVCDEWEAGRLDWSFDTVQGLIEPFPLRGHMDFYEEFQDDEGDEDVAGDAPWNDNEGPSPVSDEDDWSSAVAPARRAGPVDDLDDAQEAQVREAQERLSALDRALENAGQELQVARAIGNVRSQILKEAAGREQSDSKIAVAIRRQEEFARDLDRNQLDLEAQRRRSCEAREQAIQDALENMEVRVKELVRQEAIAVAPARQKEEAQQAAARREAIKSAAQSFNLSELGQGDTDNVIAHQQARFKLITRVFALGDNRTPVMEANWKAWLHRLDEKGRKKYTIRWAAFLQRQMGELVEKMSKGETDACLKWHREFTRDWCLNAGAFVVPGSLGGKAASSST